MKAAIPIFDDRVSPLFDAARLLVLVDIENGREIRRGQRALDESEMGPRARRVAELGVDVLICGAVSRQLEDMLRASGVQVIPQICGPVEEVLTAFVSGDLTEKAFLMPGHNEIHRQLDGNQPNTTR